MLYNVVGEGETCIMTSPGCDGQSRKYFEIGDRQKEMANTLVNSSFGELPNGRCDSSTYRPMTVRIVNTICRSILKLALPGDPKDREHRTQQM